MMKQDILIATDGDVCVSKGMFDGAKLSEGKTHDVIQEAVDQAAAQGGGAVTLSSGTYRVGKTVELHSGVHLRGAGRSTNLEVISEGESYIGISVVDAAGVTLSDMRLVSAERGAAAVGLSIEHSGETQVRDVVCQDFGDYGLRLCENSFLSEIRGCRFVRNGKANLYLKDLWRGRAGDWMPNLVTNCIAYGGGHGMEANRSLLVNFVACQAHMTEGHGFYLHDDGGSNLVTGCRTYQIGQDALRVERSNELNISSNIFCWHRGSGVVFEDIGCGAITGNEVIDSGVRTRDGSFADAIVLKGNTRSIQVSGNSIFNFGDQCPMGWGIKEEGTCHHNNIVANTINYADSGGVNSEGESSQVSDIMLEAKEAFLNANNSQPFPDFTDEKLIAYLDGRS